MKNYVSVIAMLFLIFFVSGCAQSASNRQDITTIDYTLDYSSGSCSVSTDCSYQGEGCGGGHGICSSEISQNDKQKSDIITTCEIVARHPINNGYSCVCLEQIQKCGWLKE